MKIPEFITDWVIKRSLPCKSITALASKSMDEPLYFMQRIQLRMHLLVCTMCSRYFSQIRTLRDGLREIGETDQQTDSSSTLSDEAKDRLKKSLS